MVDRALVGHAYPEHSVTVQRWQLRLFEEVVGGSAHGDAVPPTFGYALKLAVPEPLERFRAIGIDPSRILHGEQQFSYHAPLRPDHTYTVRTHIADVYERKGGALSFVVEQTEITDEAGVVVLTMRSTMVVRPPRNEGRTRPD